MPPGRVKTITAFSEPSPVLELESLESDSAGYAMLVRASVGSKCKRLYIKIDGQTYRHIQNALTQTRTGNGDRCRLSVYCRWNPFQQRYLSSITVVNSETRQVCYFPCSSAYRRSLLELQGVRSLRGLGRISSVRPDASRSVKIPGGVWRPTLLAFLSVFVTGVLISTVGLYGSWGDTNVAKHSDISEAAPGAIHKPATESLSVRGDDGGTDAELNTLVLEPGDVVYAVPEGYVALTFDDGPSAFTKDIVDILVQHQVVGTFFFIGQHVADFPEAVRYVKEHNMAVGNHSWNHINLLRVTPEDLTAEIMETNNLLLSLTDTPVTVFRPPFGLMDDRLRAFLTDAGMSTVMWNRDAEDWQANTSARDIIDYVMETHPSGGIYLLHETRQTVEALPGIIQYAKDNDLAFVMFR